MERVFGFEPVFVALLLAHLFGDFVFQTRSVVEGKERFDLSAFVWHSFHHWLPGLLLLQPYLPSRPFGSWTIQIVLLGLGLAHMGIDVGKSALGARGGRVAGFLGDQVAHVATILAASALISPIRVADYEALPGVLEGIPELYAPLAVILATVFGAGWLLHFVLVPIRPAVVDTVQGRPRNAGMYVGWLERSLVLLAILAGSAAAVGLVVVAKTIARYRSLQSRAFVVNFLVGTFLSVLVAIAGGLILRSLGIALR